MNLIFINTLVFLALICSGKSCGPEFEPEVIEKYNSSLLEIKCNIQHVAILVVGDSKPASFQKHSEEMIYHIVKPYNADMFVVTDAEGPPILNKMNLATSLPTIFGSSLKAVGLMGPITSQHIKEQLNKTENSTWDNNSPYWVVNNSYVNIEERPYIQWFKLFECWKSMEQYEKENRFMYDVVIKLRFDCTPLPTWNLCENSAVFLNNSSSSFRAIHAGTDHVFWGLRNEMKVACYEVWPAISSYFETSHRNALSRSFSVLAMLNSMKNVEPLLMKLGWKHYSKIATLPFLDMGIERQPSPQQLPSPLPPEKPSKQKTNKKEKGKHHFRRLMTGKENGRFRMMVEHLQIAYNLGINYVDPMTDRRNHFHRHTVEVETVHYGKYKLIKGLLSNYHDYTEGKFRSEKDFLVLMLMNNITVCDLGAGTNSVLYKGEVVCRPSTKCKEYVREGMLVPSLNDTNSSGFVNSDIEKKFHDASKGKSEAEEYEAR